MNWKAETENDLKVYQRRKEWLEWLEQGLRSLNAQQRDILNEFYMSRTPGYIERLMERYHVERARVYQLKDQALYDLTITLYGICDL